MMHACMTRYVRDGKALEVYNEDGRQGLQHELLRVTAELLAMRALYHLVSI